MDYTPNLLEDNCSLRSLFNPNDPTENLRIDDVLIPNSSFEFYLKDFLPTLERENLSLSTSDKADSLISMDSIPVENEDTSSGITNTDESETQISSESKEGYYCERPLKFRFRNKKRSQRALNRRNPSSLPKFKPKMRCTHCQVEKTPQWRQGPMGNKTLCNACGLRYKSGGLLPEYRPATSPSFDVGKHSNFHRKVVKMRGHAKRSKFQVEHLSREEWLHNMLDFS